VAAGGSQESAFPRERDLPNHLRHEGPSAEGNASPPTVVSPATGDKDSDFQLRTAIDYLKTWKIFRADAAHAKGT
jgi:hypothetical protein